MAAFPIIVDGRALSEWRSESSNWHSIVSDIARSHCIRTADDYAPFATGTNLVVDLGRVVLKLFPPLYRSQFVSERATLAVLNGGLSVSIPRIVAEGEREGWSYLIMSRLHVLGSDAWPILPEAEKERVLADIGRAIAEVQSVSPGELMAIEPAWPGFVAKQIAGCIERHRRQGLAPNLLSDLEELLLEAPSLLPMDAPPVILTGEWIPENFLLAEEDGLWRLAAVIDFGDVIMGWREYDLLGPSAFMCGGEPGRVRRLLEGYGLRMADLDDRMRRRLLVLTALHRASDFRNIAIDGWETRINRLVDLEHIIWPPAYSPHEVLLP